MRLPRTRSRQRFGGLRPREHDKNGLGVVLALAVVLAGCGDDPSPAEEREALVDQLAEDLAAETEGALDTAAARCVAERLADDVGVDRFDDVVDAAAEDDDDDPDLKAQVIDAFAACDALEPLLER